MAELTPEEEHFYSNSSDVVIYDIFSETETRLSGKYVALSRKASTEEEREQWWAKVMELRDLAGSVDPDALIAYIKQWQAEVSRLRGQ